MGLGNTCRTTPQKNLEWGGGGGLCRILLGTKKVVRGSHGTSVDSACVFVWAFLMVLLCIAGGIGFCLGPFCGDGVFSPSPGPPSFWLVGWLVGWLAGWLAGCWLAGRIPGITNITWTWGCLFALMGWQLGVAGGWFKLGGFWLA